MLCVNTEEDLINLINKSKELELKYSQFLEPDLDNALTAICIEPGKLTKKLVSHIKLAFK